MAKEERKQWLSNNLKIGGIDFLRFCILIVVFICCFVNEISSDGINGEKIVNNINTYFMYTFIFCNYILIKTKGWYTTEKKIEKLPSIDDIAKQSLSGDFDRNSVKIISKGNIHFIYDTRAEYYIKIRKTLKRNIVFLGSILAFVVFILQSDIQRCFLYVFQMLVTAFVNIVLFIGEIEGKELCFQKFNLVTCSEERINAEYYKLQAKIIQKEEIIYYANQPYLIIHYIKIKKAFRCIFHGVIEIILVIGILLSILDFIRLNENQFLVQLYPSLILLVIGYFDITDIRHSIFQHRVCINEIKNISCYKRHNENEIQVLFYEIDEKKRNFHNVKYYQLSIIEMSESESLKKRFKRRFEHKLRMRS